MIEEQAKDKKATAEKEHTAALNQLSLRLSDQMRDLKAELGDPDAHTEL